MAQLVDIKTIDMHTNAMVLACGVQPPYEYQGLGRNPSMRSICWLLVIPKPGTTDLWERLGSFFHYTWPGDHR